MHRMRLYKSEAGCVAVCSETHESAIAAGHHFKAIQSLNKMCGQKHKKEYNIFEAEQNFNASKFAHAAERRSSDRVREVGSMNADVTRPLTSNYAWR